MVKKMVDWVCQGWGEIAQHGAKQNQFEGTSLQGTGCDAEQRHLYHLDKRFYTRRLEMDMEGHGCFVHLASTDSIK